jgi:hypothetical protein
MSQPPHSRDGATQEGKPPERLRRLCIPVDAFVGRVPEKALRFAGNAESFLLKVLKFSRSGLLEEKSLGVLTSR